MDGKDKLTLKIRSEKPKKRRSAITIFTQENNNATFKTIQAPFTLTLHSGEKAFHNVCSYLEDEEFRHSEEDYQFIAYKDGTFLLTISKGEMNV